MIRSDRLGIVQTEIPIKHMTQPQDFFDVLESWDPENSENSPGYRNAL